MAFCVDDVDMGVCSRIQCGGVYIFVGLKMSKGKPEPTKRSAYFNKRDHYYDIGCPCGEHVYFTIPDKVVRCPRCFRKWMLEIKAEAVEVKDDQEG